jgi:hypothetical protein
VTYRTLPLLALSVLLGACRPAEGTRAGHCDNGIDDDGNGYIDCQDLGCKGSTDCQAAGTGTTETGTTETGETGTSETGSPETGPSETGDSATRYHPAGFEDPDLHGVQAKQQQDTCTSCHGEDLTGGTSEVSCDSCHTEDWRTDCTFCHGGTENQTGAPPRDISGESTDLSFLAHTAHVTETIHSAWDCTTCHVQPDDILSDGHLFVGDTTAGEAEVDLSGGLSSSGVWDGGGGCSNLYCHGNGLTHDGEMNHTESDLGCGDCHPDINSGKAAWQDMSGQHERHLDSGATCANCHRKTVSQDQAIVDPELHVDGDLDTSFSSPLTYNGSTCVGSCHIDGVSNSHTSEAW